MKTKQKAIIAISALVLTIVVILNIILLCTGVFQGKYKASGEKYRYEITFYENTFTSKIIVKKDFVDIEGGIFSVSYKKGQLVAYEYGFFQYLQKEDYEKLDGYSKYEYNTIQLDFVNDRGFPSLASTYKRNSVFSFTYAPDSEDAVTYTCATAVFLQVLYAALILASVIVLIKYRPKKN